MNVALVYDRVNKNGGAERVLLALHELFPQAPLYTAVYDPTGAPWARAFDVRPSFINRIPWAKNHHEVFPWLTPFAFESFNFDMYDVVISVTSAEAKSIITKPQTVHICYCLTPTRYLWSGYETYKNMPGLGHISGIAVSMLSLLAPTLRKWDKIAAMRPDAYVAISDRVKERIKHYYLRDTDSVIYPPVETDFFRPAPEKRDNEYYLFVSRLAGYKRADIVIDAFKSLNKPLVVIGSGRWKRGLMRQLPPTIRFIDEWLSDEALLSYYQGCKALVFAGDEDFGIVAAEAQSCGKPVIAYKESGVAEIVRDKETGVLFDKQTAASLQNGIKRFEKMRFSPGVCRHNAERFSKERFTREMASYIQSKKNQV